MFFKLSYQQEMTDTASATAVESRGGRGPMRAPGGRPYLTAEWSARGRPWNSDMGMESVRVVELPKRLGMSAWLRSGSICSARRAWVSTSAAVATASPLSFFTLELGGSNPYKANRRKRQPVPTYTGPCAIAHYKTNLEKWRKCFSSYTGYRLAIFCLLYLSIFKFQ